MNLIYHVILEDHVIIWSCDVNGRSHSMPVTIIPHLVAINIVVMEIRYFFFAA